MAKKPERADFSYSALTAILIKALGIREGHWGLRFDFGAYPKTFSIEENQVNPTLMGVSVTVENISLIRLAEPDVTSVDAAEANPPLIMNPHTGAAMH